MTILRPAEVVLLRGAFHQATGEKIRPAVVLLDTGDDDFVAAPITSLTRISLFDVILSDWSQAGLNVPSTVRVHKLAVRPKALLVRRLGVLTSADQLAVWQSLAFAFGT